MKKRVPGLMVLSPGTLGRKLGGTPDRTVGYRGEEPDRIIAVPGAARFETRAGQLGRVRPDRVDDARAAHVG